MRNDRVTSGSAEDNAEEILRLTKEYLRRLCAHDFEWCLSKVSDPFVFIGPRKEHYCCSRKEFEHVLDSLEEEYRRSTITEESYNVVMSSSTMCVVTGHFLVLTPPDDEKILPLWYSHTFVWRRSGRRITLKHLHLSRDVDFEREMEAYPVHAGTETYRYMKSLMRLGSSRKSVSLYDTDGTVHWVHPSQIIYLEANRKRTIVHCMTKEIVVPAVIRDTVEMVGNKIMRVHRSYAVNRDHVVELKAGRLLLDDGTSIAIPAKRIADVRAELTGG